MEDTEIQDTSSQEVVQETQQETPDIAKSLSTIFSKEDPVFTGEQKVEDDGWKTEAQDTETESAETEEVADTEVAEETETEEVEVEPETPKVPEKLTVKLDGKDEDLDLTDPEVIEKLKNGYQMNWNYDRKVREANEMKAHAEGLYTQLAFAKLRDTLTDMQSNPGAYRDFVAMTEDDFIGKSDKEGAEAEAEEKQMWQNHIKEVETMKLYQKGFRNMQEGLYNLKSQFAEKHPEITDVNEWIKENITPYAAPFETFGGLPYPEDTFEMIHYWKNREANEANWQKRVDDALAKGEKEGERKVAKKPVVKKSDTKAVRTNETPGDKIVKQMFGTPGNVKLEDVFSVRG